MSTVRGGSAWIGFLAMAFAVTGLIGVFSTYAIAIPYERGMQEERALDAALATGGREDALEALRPRLAEQADLVIGGGGALGERVVRARAELAARVQAQASSLADRMRFLIALFTAVSALFGAMVLSVTRRTP